MISPASTRELDKRKACPTGLGGRSSTGPRRGFAGERVLGRLGARLRRLRLDGRRRRLRRLRADFEPSSISVRAAPAALPGG